MRNLLLFSLCSISIVAASIIYFPSLPKPRVITGKETVTVYGQVGRQGEYPWKPGMTVRDVILNDAGGLTQFANSKKIKVWDKNTTESLLHKLRSMAYEAVRPAEEILYEFWAQWSLPGNAPDFGFIAPDPIAKAIVNLRDPRSDFVLDPDDIVIVCEMLLNL